MSISPLRGMSMKNTNMSAIPLAKIFIASAIFFQFAPIFSEISETQGNAEFLLKNGSYLGRNDLKSVVMANSKTLSCCEKDVSRVTGLPVSMSGSGATLFLAFSSQSEAEKVLKGCQKDLPQYQFILTRAV